MHIVEGILADMAVNRHWDKYTYLAVKDFFFRICSCTKWVKQVTWQAANFLWIKTTFCKKQNKGLHVRNGKILYSTSHKSTQTCKSFKIWCMNFQQQSLLNWATLNLFTLWFSLGSCESLQSIVCDILWLAHSFWNALSAPHLANPYWDNWDK